MNREATVWTVLFVCGVSFLAYRAVGTERGVGNKYVIAVETAGVMDEATGKMVSYKPTDVTSTEPLSVRREIRYQSTTRDTPNARWSLSNTLGLWIAALLTLFAFSYLYKDNVCYKLTESVIVGVSAGYWMVLNFWEVLVAKLLVKLSPDAARYAFLPDTPPNAEADLWYLIPLIVGCLVFCRWVPRISYLARWPLAFVVGTTAGLKLIQFIEADFIAQIRSTILPLIVLDRHSVVGMPFIDWKQSIQNIVLVASVLASLTYFYFSVEHKGLVGRVSRAGVWVLMITFGASFALTVMGRITLLTMRLQFLFDDWLGIVRA